MERLTSTSTLQQLVTMMMNFPKCYQIAAIGDSLALPVYHGANPSTLLRAFLVKKGKGDVEMDARTLPTSGAINLGNGHYMAAIDFVYTANREQLGEAIAIGIRAIEALIDSENTLAQPKQTQGWHGVDLDGTLAHYDGWKGIDHIGEPIPLMVKRVKAWLEAGEGVKIMTARVSLMFSRDPKEFADSVHAREYIEAWCLVHIGVKLPVTCAKDFAMIDLWDDRAVQIELNTGRTMKEVAIEESRRTKVSHG